jgi:putative tricarboxylic transport membrane protein
MPQAWATSRAERSTPAPASRSASATRRRVGTEKPLGNRAGRPPRSALDDFVEAWKQDPGGTSISGGSLGSIDHLLTGLVAEEVGIDPAKTNCIAYSGGGEALTSMLSGTTVAGISGYNEVADQIDAGMLRALVVSSEERLPGVDVPTFTEHGVDAVMANWRGLAAAPGVEGG